MYKIKILTFFSWKLKKKSIFVSNKINMEGIRMKKGVNITELSPKIKDILPAVIKACKFVNGKDYIVTITSGNDGKHMKGSKHYINEAIDIRTKDMKPNKSIFTVIRIKKYIKELGRNDWDYDIIDEGTHIHIEYDKFINKKGGKL
jgi:hypothetical protein